MTILGNKIKQPVEELDYDISYKDFLTDSDELNTSLTPNVVITPDKPGGLVKGIVTITEDRVKVWLKSGISGDQYKIEVTVKTNEGRIRQDEFYINVQEF